MIGEGWSGALLSLAIPCQSLSNSPQPSVWKLITLEGVIFGLEADDCSTSVAASEAGSAQLPWSSFHLHCAVSPEVTAAAEFLPCPPISPLSRQTLDSRVRDEEAQEKN